MEKARQILKTVFGYDDFISIQATVIRHVLSGQDTLAVMPTGGGKSLCYQVPALIFKGLTIVVSPLISLMNDQIQQLHQNGVAAVMLNSALALETYQQNLQSIKNGRSKLLYVAPETLLKPELIDLLAQIQVDCLAVDEVHCVSEWGHDFRPEYRRLSQVRERLSKAVCLALTATATHQVRQDIKTTLALEKGVECVAGFDRPNLFLQVSLKDNPYAQTLKVIRSHAGQSGIIYCATRRQVDQLAAALTKEGISALPYHAGLPDTVRHRNQQYFSRDDIQVVVATIAFGMGIDKSNVRFVIHFDLPKNIESYYQEIGRAGRDGARSHCLLLYSYGDIHKIKYMINNMAPNRQRTANLLLTAMLRYVESDECRRKVLLDYFGDHQSAGRCDMCDKCLMENKPTIDLTIAAQKLLSCVKRTNECFGVTHVIDILRGSRSQKILNLGHDKLSTYNIGQEYSKLQWRQLARQLLHKGFMIQDMNHGALKLTSKAWELFKGDMTFYGILTTEASSSDSNYPSPPQNPKDNSDFDPKLFEILRNQRKLLADEARVPPFVVFSDKTLMELAIWFPQSPERFRDIHGIGRAKEQKYGPIFIEHIRRYCEKKGIDERQRPDSLQKDNPLAISKRTLSGQKPRFVEVSEAYNYGRSIQQLMTQYNVKRNTIINHLFTYCREGHSLRCNGLRQEIQTNEATQKRVLASFNSLGAEQLSPVYHALNKSVSYDELHLLRLYYLNCENQAQS